MKTCAVLPGYRMCPGCAAPCDAGNYWPGGLLTDLRPLFLDTGQFCAGECVAFSIPDGLQMTSDCRVQNIDECFSEIHGCDHHATCKDLDPLLHQNNDSVKQNARFECSCNDMVFPVLNNGEKCSTSGIEIEFQIVDSSDEIGAQVSENMIPCLAGNGFILQDTDYAAPQVSVDTESGAVHARIAMHHVHTSAEWKNLGLKLEECLQVNISKSDVCEDDYTRQCELSTCSTCRMDWPTVVVTVIENSLDNSVVQVSSFGYSLTSTSFRGLKWRLELTYDEDIFLGTNGMDNVPFVFLSKSANVDNIHTEDGPCALGDLNIDSCCVSDLDSMYTISSAFSDEIKSVVGDGVGCEASAWRERIRQKNTTGSGLHVGSFRGLGNNSYTSTSPLRPGRVVIVLVYEDVVNAIGRKDKIDDAEHITFFLGLGIMRFREDVVMVTAPPLHLYSKITSQYYFTSQVQTAEKYSPALFIQLVRVYDATNALYHDFAHLTVYLPETQKFDTDNGDLLPLLSARAGIGYTSEETDIENFYPCVLRPDWEAYEALPDCKHPLPVCTTTISFDGVVGVIFPLGIGFFDIMMEKYNQWNIIPLNLYLDFVIRVRDGDGRNTFSRFYTSTRLRRESMEERCTAKFLQESLASLVDVSTIHGMVENETMALNLKRSENLTIADVDVTKASHNFDTLILAGNASFFSKSGHESHGIDLESVITLFFMSTLKKNYVLQLIELGDAFEYDQALGSYMPTLELLTLCPLSRVSSTQGCMAMWQVRGHVMDVYQHSAFPIVPQQSSLVNETFTDNSAREWLQARPWARHNLLELDEISTHTQSIGRSFDINGRFSKAFVFASDIPILSINQTNPEYVQFYLRLFTVRIDLRTPKTTYSSPISSLDSIFIQIPAIQSSWEFSVNQAIHDCIRTSFALIFGLKLGEVHVPPGNVSNVSFYVEMHLPWSGSTNIHHKRLQSNIQQQGSSLRQRLEAGLRRNIRALPGDTNLISKMSGLSATARWKVELIEHRDPRRRLLYANAENEATTQNYTSKLQMTQLLGVENGDQIINNMLGRGNLSSLAPYARIVSVTITTPKINPCSMNESTMIEIMEAELSTPFDEASRGTIDTIIIYSLVVENFKTLECGTRGATRRILQTELPSIAMEIFIIPLTISGFYFESTPLLISIGVRRIVFENSNRQNASSFEFGPGVSSDGYIFPVIQSSLPASTTPMPQLNNNKDAILFTLMSLSITSLFLIFTASLELITPIPNKQRGVFD